MLDYEDRLSLRAVLWAVVIVLGCLTGLVLATFALGSWHGAVDQTFREVKLVNVQLRNVGTLINDARERVLVMDHQLVVLQQRINALEARVVELEPHDRRR